ncbi:hypothetical protein ABIB40_002272 [Pedobacter sp. UYP30]|uniref:LPS export ABC transporter periplasmic protein LptC n=1 Tax=Pedobacter sp. UYP30 TaxID=1756400 RepID=UPI00339A82B0
MKKIGFLLSVSILMLLFLAGCGSDDLKNVSAISAKKITFSRERTLGVEIIYSDSALVKARGVAPILDKITPSTGGAYQEMIKGVKIDFFAKDGEKDGTLTSDYAIKKDSEQKTTFKKHVVVKNSKGDTFSSEELIWDEAKKLFYSNLPVTVKTTDGNSVEGMDFEAPQDFSSYKITRGSGEVKLKDELAP